MSFFEWLFALNPLWVLWSVFFLMILISANGRQSDSLDSFSIVGVVIVTLAVGHKQGQILDAIAGLVIGLLLGIGIPFLVRIR